MDQTAVEQVIGVGIDSSLEKEDSRLQEFKSMLAEISSLDDKKKILWLHIYENAIQDRRNAYALLFELVAGVKGKPGDHHLTGPILSKYIERMSRANEQLLKLAELIQKAQDEEEKFDPEDIWAEIEKKEG